MISSNLILMAALLISAILLLRTNMKYQNAKNRADRTLDNNKLITQRLRESNETLGRLNEKIRCFQTVNGTFITLKMKDYREHEINRLKKDVTFYQGQYLKARTGSLEMSKEEVQNGRN